MTATVDVLVPTRHRPIALAATLATQIGQSWRAFDVVVSDQSDGAASFDTGETSSIVCLPDEHCGQDVLAQLRAMARFDGCGEMPSGAYHQELPTTVPHRDVDAPLALHARASEATA